MEQGRRSWLAAGLVSALGLAGSAQAQSPQRARAEAERAATNPRAGGAKPAANGGRVIRVGPRGEVVAASIAADLAQDGDIVEIEAGAYPGDVAVWKQKRLTIRAVGGRARMIAAGKHAEGKAIWVLRDGDFDISGIDFEGTRVPSRNGAGIRFERGRLRLSDCRFIDNENGLLTGNDEHSEIIVHGCQFSGMFTRPSTGHYHNLYVGAIGRCEVTSSYFSRAQVGHLLKTRARESVILYNRITDEEGCASYELEFPNGGRTLAMGNLIVQGPATENGGMVFYGAEGYRWKANEFLFVHNTVVSRRPGSATFARVFPGSALGLMRNNLFVGRGGFEGVLDGPDDGNVHVRDESFFVDPGQFDFHLQARASFKGSARALTPIGDAVLVPTMEYLHPASARPLAEGVRLSPGAFQS